MPLITQAFPREPCSGTTGYRFAKCASVVLVSESFSSCSPWSVNMAILASELRSSNSIRCLIICFGTLHPRPHLDSLEVRRLSPIPAWLPCSFHSPLFRSISLCCFAKLGLLWGNWPFVLNTSDAYDTARVALAYGPKMRSLAPTQSIRGARLVPVSVLTLAPLTKRQLSAAIPDGIFYAVRTVSWCFDHSIADSKQLRSIPLK